MPRQRRRLLLGLISKVNAVKGVQEYTEAIYMFGNNYRYIFVRDTDTIWVAREVQRRQFEVLLLRVEEFEEVLRPLHGATIMRTVVGRLFRSYEERIQHIRGYHQLYEILNIDF